MISDAGRDKLLVHFSGDDWWQSNPHSRHHITNQFYLNGYRVLWINPMGLRFPSVKKRGFIKKLLNKLLSLSKAVKEVDRNFYVFTPFYFPVFSQGVTEKFNAALMYMQLRLVLSRIGVDYRVAFVTLPTFAPMVRKSCEADLFEKIIYYYSDQYDKYREIRDPAPILAWDAMLQDDADAIYCASDVILQSVSDKHRRSKPTRVISHQVDFELFDFHNVKPARKQWQSPVIGYFGSLTDSNNWSMVEYAASRKPKWQFVFIGKKLIDLPALESLPNVHFTGFIPYEKLPSIAVNFDVGIMFWKMTDWIKACSPLKLKEYLALGLPVVSVPIDEVVTKYSDYVKVANDGPEFVDAIGKCLELEVSDKHRSFAKKYSWSFVFKSMCVDCGLN